MQLNSLEVKTALGMAQHSYVTTRVSFQFPSSSLSNASSLWPSFSERLLSLVIKMAEVAPTSGASQQEMAKCTRGRGCKSHSVLLCQNPLRPPAYYRINQHPLVCLFPRALVNLFPSSARLVAYHVLSHGF